MPADDPTPLRLPSLDALLALRSLRAANALHPRWSLGALHALGAIGTGLPLYPLRPLRAWIPLRALERTGGYPGHGRATALWPARTHPLLPLVSWAESSSVLQHLPPGAAQHSHRCAGHL